jgi:hypothetical protein
MSEIACSQQLAGSEMVMTVPRGLPVEYRKENKGKYMSELRHCRIGVWGVYRALSDKAQTTKEGSPFGRP